MSCLNRVVKFQTDFTYIEQNSSDVTTPLYLGYKDDYLYVCDDDTIIVLTSDGLVSTTSYSDTTLDTPGGIEINNDEMFISDIVNDTIAVWRRYNPFDSLESGDSIKFGSRHFDQPAIIAGDTLIAGDTGDYSPNHWKEEKTNNWRTGVEESNVSSTWTEESNVSSTWTEES